MRTIDRIVVHCSATRSGTDLLPDALDRMHRQRGFNGTGYHFYIRRDGTVVTARPIEKIGAHAKGYNAHSVGICYEGGLNRQGKAMDTRTEEQKESLASLIVWLKSKYPDSVVCGHRDLSPDLNGNGMIEPNEWIKMCPCFDAQAEYENLM